MTAPLPGRSAGATDAMIGPREDASAGIRPVPRDRPLPLSFAQRRLWFLDRLEPGGTLYNVPVALRIGGALDVAALERGLGEIVRRHEPLRTTFAAADGDAVQMIAPPGDFHLPVEDISLLPDPEAEAHRRARLDADTPFDLERGPLFRARLLRVDADDHLLLLAMHHAVSDGWSMGVLFGELRALYGAFAAGRPLPLQPLPVQYADFAVWQRAALSGDALQARLAWWRRALHGAPALLELPLDHPRPPVQTYRAAGERLLLPPELAGALAELARRERATLFMVVLAAYQALLARWSGQDDVVVGTPVAGRTRKETERLIGFFVNTLAVRTDVSGDPTFRELLGRVREAALEATVHQDLPFEKLVEEIQPARSQSHSPVFQAFFVLQNAWDGQVELPGLEVRRADVEDTVAKFDLSLGAMETPRGLSCGLFYNVELFEPETIRRMLGQLGALLAAAAADPARRLSELPLLTGEERARIAAWERGPAQPRTIPSFPAQLAEAVRARPHAVAVEHGEGRVTYAELDARANRIAHRLRRLGVGPDTVVALCLERTPALIAALVAVMKAGGAYLPLEPRFPAARVAALLRDSGAAVLVAEDAVLAAVDLPPGCASLSPADPSLAAESPEDPGVEIDPRTVAWVLYTSGSTGTPKGVMVTHGSLAALVAWQRERFPLAEGEKVLGATSVAFDVHASEIHYALADGATLVLVENALLLAELPRDPALAHAQMVPSAARELLAAGRFPPLRRVGLAGEALAAELVDGLYAAGVGEVHNLYGPTEDTVFATHARCAPGTKATIGLPLAGRRAYVLDASLRRTPVGVVGEVYLAGRGVARGYLGRPGLTASRFLPDPYGAPGERIYATGDRARRLATGEIEYLGRADFQVKVRGFRVEPGEIESVLRGHPAVADAVVAPRGPAEDRRLAAWVVPAPGAAPSAAELAAWLKARLPAYMVPAAIAIIDALPRTASGKPDRNALPDPDFAAEARAFVAPRTPTEAALAEVWAEVLRMERVGAEDDFFALGGHSLLAMQVWGAVQQRFGIELPLRAHFDHPTLAALAAGIDDATRAALPPVEEPRLVARRRTLRAVRIAGAEPVEVGED